MIVERKKIHEGFLAHPVNAAVQQMKHRSEKVLKLINLEKTEPERYLIFS